MASRETYQFGPFSLDPSHRILSRGETVLRVTPKAFDLLVALARRRGAVAGREELFREVWSDCIVEDATLSQHIFLLRKLLRTAAGAPSPIATVPRRGYRFALTVYDCVSADDGDRSSPSVAANGQPAALFVGRQRELDELALALRTVAQDHSRVVCISGEAGVGKSALCDNFVRREAAGPKIHAARSRCSERFGNTDSYLPIVDLLDDLRHQCGAPFSAVLRSRAPDWYDRVEPGGADAQRAPIQSLDQLKRQLRLVLEEISRDLTLVLFIDDWHWAAPSTADVLAYLANHFDSMRILFILAYRDADIRLSNPAFISMKLDLQTRSRCHDLSLGPLAYTDVVAYVEGELQPYQAPAGLVDFVHGLTEGNPLFMVDLVRHLRSQAFLTSGDDGWRLSRRIVDLRHELPESTRSMIERTLGQLEPADRALLAESSVQGQQFDSAILADALNVEASRLEDRLLTLLGTASHIIAKVEECDLPDGTVNTSYAFNHVLYQNVLYDSLSATRKVLLSRNVADALLAHHPHRERVAARVAILLETARDSARAVEWYSVAAQRALSMSAFPEAIKLARRGLALLRSLKPSGPAESNELPLLLTLGAAMGAREGCGDLEVRRTYGRAYRLLGSANNNSSLVPTLLGLWTFYGLRGEMRRAGHISKELLRLATDSGDRDFLARACATHGGCLVHLGELSEARGLLERGLALESSEPKPLHVLLDSRVHGLSHLAEVLSLLGYLDQAVERAQESIDIAGRSDSPYALPFALTFSALVHKRRRDVRRAKECADEAVRIAAQHQLADALAWASSLQSWASCQGGLAEQAVAQMRTLIEEQRSTGRNPQYFFGMFAEVLMTAGHSDEGLGCVDQAIAMARKSGDEYCFPELFCVKSRLMALAGDHQSAIACIVRAIEEASRQAAKTWKLEALITLCDLRHCVGECDQATDESVRELLLLCSSFAEGGDTELLRTARRTVRTLGRPHPVLNH
jgi:DNA-binding winged helix-turn-helix (wHTH) protein/tetratricopeptide (TPR) repeat protein